MIPIFPQKQFEFKTAEELKQYIHYQDRNPEIYSDKFIYLQKMIDFSEVDRFNLLPLKEFQQNYDANKPVIINNLDQGWQNWNWNYLINTYGEESLRAGIDDDGNYLKLKFSKYINYIQKNADYNPVYVFDGDIPEQMLQQYSVPDLFPQDFLMYIKQKRPQYRWILCGPKKSGSMIHVDPYETSAWNCVVIGKKRWVMFPPDIDKKVVQGKSILDKEQLRGINNPIDYFYELVPKIKDYCKAENIVFYDFIQNEHETVYVPNGWWHAVLNIEDCVAVTQNYVGDANFDKFWIAFNKENPVLSKQFYKTIEMENQLLYKQAQQLNEKFHINYCQLEKNTEQQCEQENKSEQDSLEEFQNQFD